MGQFWGKQIDPAPLFELDPVDREALDEYWRFYEPRSAVISRDVRREWKPVFEAITRDQTDEADRHRHQLLRDAIVAGRWQPYLQDLRSRGVRYAQAGMTYSGWFDLIRVFRDTTRRVMAAECHLPMAEHGMYRLLDIAVQNIGEAYLETKQKLVAPTENLYRTMFDRGPVPMWLIDRETLRFITVNDAAVRHYGYSRDELATMTVPDLEPTAEDRSRHRKKDGSIIDVHIAANDFEDGGRPLRLAVISDVTNRQAKKLDAITSAEPPAATTGRLPLIRDAGVRARVLVVDDEDLFRKSVARFLRRLKLDVVEVNNGRSAIAELEAKAFDVVLSDVHMPGMDGLDLMRAIRGVDLDVPIVLMSGEPDVVSATTAIEYGAFRYLVKPFEVDVLGKTIQHAVRVHTLARIRREAFAVCGTHAGAADRVGLEVQYDQALAQLWMAYQPIFEASTGALYGVEALLRSGEPSLALPNKLLAAAEQLARLPELGRKVRSLSAAALADRHDLVLFVNLHPDDLMDLDLLDEASPLTAIASRVVLEVTERASLASSPELSARLARLRKSGFRLAVDDIGAGYSGLTSFTELVPEVVKIDMSLVRDIDKSALKQRTVTALCRLCREVGCLVVAEGVETVDEQLCLVTLGCDLLQGYLLGRPDRALPAGHRPI